ncbi:MAG: sensor histidine kinase [Cellulosilyticaceae bacterium]
MKPLKHYSIKRQFYLILVCLLITCSVLGLAVDQTVQNLLLDKKIDYAKTTATKFESEINYLYSRISNIYEYLQLEKTLEDFFIAPLSSELIPPFTDIQRKILALSILSRDIADIALVSDQIYHSNLYDQRTLKTISTDLDTSSAIKSLGIITPSFYTLPDTPYLVFARNMFAFQNMAYYRQKLGSIVISIDPNKSAITLPQTEDLSVYFMLLDRNNNIYPFNCDLPTAQGIVDSNFQLPDAASRANHTSMIEYVTSDYMVYASYIPEMDCYVLSAVDKLKLFDELRSMRLLIIFIIIMVSFFMYLLMRLLLNNVIKPLNDLYSFMQSIRDGNLRNLKRTVTLEGCTEIVALCDSFNNMLSEINGLNKQLFQTTTHLYETEIEKSKAEIAHLRSQINPHFLYNTLESMRGIALDNDVPEIATISLGMGKIFRYSIKGAPTAPLSEELAIVQAYIAIQLIRFDHKFDVFYSINPATEKIFVPKMILQPLVENAIFHGLEKKLETGTLYIGATCTDDGILKITIQDDGVGMSQEILTKLQGLLLKADAMHTSQHIGLLNVHYRIRLAYGMDYGLQIDSQSLLGTKITILLPLTNQGEELHYV